MTKDVERYIENLARYQRVFTDFYLQTIREIIEVHKLERGFIGTLKITDLKRKMRIYDYSLMDNKYSVGGIDLYGTEASKYSVLCNKDKMQKFHSWQVEEMESKYAALYFRRWRGEGVYVDIRSFYWEIIRRFWGIEYSAGKWMGVGKSGLGFDDVLGIGTDKFVRNAVYGLIRARNVVRFDATSSGLKMTIVKMRNELLYPSLCSFIYDVSQLIAFVAKEKFGAVYCYIDGFIVPSPSLDSFLEFLSTLGFEGRIKAAGDVDVVGLGSYRVGEYESGFYRQRQRESGAQEYYSNIYVDDDFVRWFLERFRRLTVF